MKRSPHILLVCILAFLFLHGEALAAETDTRFVGVWYLNTFRIGDSTFNAGDTGTAITISIGDDGTVTRTDPDGSVEAGMWIGEGDTILISWDDGSALELIYVEGALVSNPDGGLLTLHLEGSPPEKTPDTRPPWRKDAKATDFDGQWMSTQINTMGMAIPMGDLGERVDPLIKGGKLTALNGTPVDPSVTTEFIAATLLIHNPITGVTSAMNLLQDGSAVLMHLHAPEAYFTLIPMQ